MRESTGTAMLIPGLGAVTRRQWPRRSPRSDTHQRQALRWSCRPAAYPIWTCIRIYVQKEGAITPAYAIGRTTSKIQPSKLEPTCARPMARARERVGAGQPRIAAFHPPAQLVADYHHRQNGGWHEEKTIPALAGALGPRYGTLTNGIPTGVVTPLVVPPRSGPRSDTQVAPTQGTGAHSATTGHGRT